nr:hypothetical protein [Leptospira kirschneri]
MEIWIRLFLLVEQKNKSIDFPFYFVRRIRFYAIHLKISGGMIRYDSVLFFV